MSGQLWPDGTTGAVSLTFDDGRRSQLERALPLMAEYELKGTFYLCPGGENWRAYLEPWRAAHQGGHEVGNHTASHICSRQTTGAAPGPGNLEGLTPTDVERDILLAEARISEVIGPRPRSFCYPCYQAHVGEGAGRQSYVPIVARHFCAGRVTGEFGYNHPASADLHYLWSWRCEGLSAEQMIGLAEESAHRGSWDIFVFHGIDDGRLGVTPGNFERFLAHLARRRERIWTAPVYDVAQRILTWRQTA
ncbi:MAG TPA: polysaccharide deacetylase family protein [Limnochordia bacterium]|nr:polysaccharide deacetylase family protein [Limnochordia bacterium]